MQGPPQRRRVNARCTESSVKTETVHGVRDTVKGVDVFPLRRVLCAVFHFTSEQTLDEKLMNGER